LVTCRKHSALAYHNNKSAPVCYVVSDIFSREYVIIFLSDNYFTPVGEAKYCNDCVCLCLFVCLSVHDHISGTTRPIFVHVPYGRGSVVVWQRSDTLCTGTF